MTYLIQQYTNTSDAREAEFASLTEARAAAAEWLGGNLNDEMRGSCPDEDELIGVECWMPYIDSDHVPVGTVFIYRTA